MQTQNELHRRALAHYARGEFSAAFELIMELQEAGALPVELQELLDDIRLQLKLAEVSVQAREAPAPPRRPTRPVAIVLLALCAILLVGGGVLFWPRPATPPSTAAAPPTLTSTPASPATPVPTATPPATATPLPSATPPAPSVTPVPNVSGLLRVLLPEGQESVMRAPRNVAIILDASGSMQARVGTQTRIAITRSAVSAMINDLPAETKLALRTYGSQRSRDCGDLTLVRALDRHDRSAFLADLAQIEPAFEGMTPTGAALEALVDDLRGAEGSSVAILVSDGEENCGGDPVAASRVLVEANPQLRIHVIGLDIGDAAAAARLREIAKVGRGSYFAVDSTSNLAEALREAVQLSYSVLNLSGEPVASGQVGGAALQLVAGSYRILLDSNPPGELVTSVRAAEQTVLRLSPDGQRLELTTQP